MEEWKMDFVGGWGGGRESEEEFLPKWLNSKSGDEKRNSITSQINYSSRKLCRVREWASHHHDTLWIKIINVENHSKLDQYLDEMMK